MPAAYEAPARVRYYSEGGCVLVWKCQDGTEIELPLLSPEVEADLRQQGRG